MDITNLKAKCQTACTQFRRQLDIIRQRVKEARMEILLVEFRNRFPEVQSLDIEDNFLGVNGYLVEVRQIDHYENMLCEFPKALPVNLLEPLAWWFLYNHDRELHAYRYRTVQTLLICYFEQHYMAMSASDLASLVQISSRLPCERGDRARQGFRAWLLTRSYCCADGGFIRGHRFRDWPHHQEFAELLAAQNQDI